MTTVQMLKGSELDESDLNTINVWRKKEFDSKVLFNSDNTSSYFSDEFFIVKDNQEMVSFGRLRPLTVVIQDRPYDIWGIASIVSIKKRQGYGRKLMQSILQHIQQHSLTVIGFCGKRNTPFYRKCGFEILEDGQKYFVYFDDEDNKHYEAGDVLYYPKDNAIIQEILKNKNTIVKHFVPHW